ncbi:HSP20-like chaperone [Xylona heveae TC161]|uniref:HSP20-like chaperone n=1 Tax=Xylona heveae (strain CBS 132557 / TC161) TaxID=1328760 RepID=A0A165IAW6_XYLHT|nr:HSP20-like chaperone [Xylona heveae TC161]KZF24643.1 HSP20-like chaperone [Xylona heveae TC161]
MSFFSQFPGGDFAPLFRLLDDYDVHRAAKSSGTLRSFQPRFDVREVKDAYELHGELPGIEQKDISIEFTDPTTLVIKGRTEREYSAGTPPAGAIEGGEQPQEQPQGERYKYWVSERSVGQFHRSFSFPSRVNQDAVKASLKNGILSIVVPKAPEPTSRRIFIE